MHSVIKDKKVVFFDLGYTLMQPASGNWMLTRRFYEVVGDRLRSIDKQSFSDAFAYAFKYLDDNHHLTDVEEEYRQFKHFFQDINDQLKLGLSEAEVDDITYDHVYNVDNYVPYKDAVSVVTAISKTHRIGVISDTWPSITAVLKKMGIYDLFDSITYSCEVGAYKPDPRMYEDALTKMGCQPNEAVFIDDGVRNLDGAAKAGITPILIAAESFNDVETSYTKIHSLSELLQ